MHGGCCYFLPKYYGTAQESELSQYLLMEFVNGEPLDVFLKQRKATVSLRTKLFLLLNIVHGMRFLISREIVHLDLKPSNVLIDKKLIPKIIDFGSAYHRELCPKRTYVLTQTTLLASHFLMLLQKSISNIRINCIRERGKRYHTLKSRIYLLSVW